MSTKTEAARVLYMEGYKQVDIARVFRVSENTVSKWQKKGRWADIKLKQDIMQESSVITVTELVNYQLRALKQRKDKYERDLEEGEVLPLLERGDISALQLLMSTIKNDKKKFADYVHVMKEFATYVNAEDQEAAKIIVEFQDRFIKEKQKVL